MEIHQLRYFVEVVQTGSFTKAAQRCHVTQPTLSHQIRKLEDILGEPLLQRLKQGVQTTPLGESFYPRALAILKEVKAAEEDAAAFSGDLKGSLHIGVIPTVAPYLMPGLLESSRHRFPQLTFHITEDTTENLLEAMRNGMVDCALLSLPIQGEEWTITRLIQDEILVALPRRHPLGKFKDVRLLDLVTEPLVLMKEAHCLRGQSLQICNRTGWKPDVFFHSSQIDTLLAMVETGFGVSFVPALARSSLYGRKVLLRSIAPERAYRTLALIHHRNSTSTRALQHFREICRKCTEKLGTLDEVSGTL
ncbi:MAG TPA: LysR substrate-binding domain-containing protein [Candidatus Methylacidiphilales bacterium]|nr:LysR substrate-binding domain-containing protein [Candidatus Methylacidiphilales bacterium]